VFLRNSSVEANTSADRLKEIAEGFAHRGVVIDDENRALFRRLDRAPAEIPVEAIAAAGQAARQFTTPRRFPPSSRNFDDRSARLRRTRAK
jgi:hypothetical protein